MHIVICINYNVHYDGQWVSGPTVHLNGQQPIKYKLATSNIFISSRQAIMIKHIQN